MMMFTRFAHPLAAHAERAHHPAQELAHVGVAGRVPALANQVLGGAHREVLFGRGSGGGVGWGGVPINIGLI